MIPGLGRSPGGGHGNPLQYACLDNPTDRGVWQAVVHGVAESDTRKSAEHTRTQVEDSREQNSSPVLTKLVNWGKRQVLYGKVKLAPYQI